MITKTEESLFRFFKEKCKEYFDYSSLKDENGVLKKQAVTVFRGYPEREMLDWENREAASKFPYIAIRATGYRTKQTGIDVYENKCDFEIWTATRGEDDTSEKEYLNNLKLCEFVQKCLLEEPTIHLEYSVDTESDFAVDFFKDQTRPYYMSCITFTCEGGIVENRIIENDIEKDLINQFTGGK